MSKIGVFIHVTLDGFFAGPNDEIDWFKVIKKDAEWEKHIDKESQSGNTLLFGATTYRMMKGFWPTPAGIQSDPDMAKAVNESPKIVVSNTLKSVEDESNWKNVRILHDLDYNTITKLKEESSSSGKYLFKDVKMTEMTLIEARSFKNGLVSLRYRPVR